MELIFGKGTQIETKQELSAEDGVQASFCSVLLRVTLASVASLYLTSFGFFTESVPLWVSFAPFVLALLSSSSLYRGSWYLGYFGTIAIVVCWSLVANGLSIWIALVAGIGFTLAITFVFVRLGFAIGMFLMLLFPWLPGNPLLFVGSFLPGFGLAGWAVFISLFAGLHLIDFRPIRAALLAATLGSFSYLSWDFFKEEDNLQASMAPLKFEELQLGELGDLGADWRVSVTLSEFDSEATVFTGENEMHNPNPETLERLCRVIERNNIILYMGLRDTNGESEVRKFTKSVCGRGLLVYKAPVGIPGFSGDLFPGLWHSLRYSGNVPNSLEVTFLAGYEVFSAHRWLAASQSGSNNIIVLADDEISKNFRVDVLRSKVAAVQGNLFGIRFYSIEKSNPNNWLAKLKNNSRDVREIAQSQLGDDESKIVN